MNRIRPGTTMVFTEDDFIAEVEVLEDNSDEEWKKYKLKVLRTIRPSAIYKTIPDGHIFEVSLRKRIAFGGMWNLEELRESRKA